MENPFINCTIPALLDPNVCPGLAAPPGVIPMDPNAYTLHPYVIASTVVCASLTLVGVVIRVFTKAYVLKRMQFEDCELILVHHAHTCANLYLDCLLFAAVRGSYAHIEGGLLMFHSVASEHTWAS